MIPSYTFINNIVRDTILQSNLYRSGRIRDFLDQIPDRIIIQFFEDFAPQPIVSHGADSISFRPQPRRMVDKIDRSTTCFLSCWQHVPQEFSYAYYDRFLIVALHCFIIVYLTRIIYYLRCKDRDR